MSLFQELRQRRVFQITSGYVVGSWGLLQFLAFLEDRMAVSHHLVDLVGLTLLLLLPSVVTLVWVHGRPGKDLWGRAPKVVVPANLLAAGVLLVLLFHGRDLGAVTQTISVEDENGSVSERVVPKSEYRRRVLIFYPEYAGPEEDAWASEAAAFLLRLDVTQDVFVDALVPLLMVDAFREAGSEDGHGLSRPRQRKLARDSHIGYFLTGSLERQDERWRLTSELHESESGKIVARRTTEAPDFFALVDQASLELREDLGIPTAHRNESPDLPIAEMTSSDPQAVAGHVRGLLAVTHLNDWELAERHLTDAVERDPDYALAQFLLSAVRETLNDKEGSAAALTASMENLYRVPERVSFPIKAQYYFTEKQDSDRAMAVLRMWSQIYPNDVDAYEMLGLFHLIRREFPGAIAAYEQILAVDPSRVRYLEELADLHAQLGNFGEAEDYLKQYVEIFPGRAKGYRDLADFYRNTGRLTEARAALDHAQLLEPENLNLALKLIDLDMKEGKYEESEKSLAELLAGAETTGERQQVCGRQLMLAAVRGRAADLIDRLESFYAASRELRNPMQADLIHSMMLPAVSMAGQPEEALSRLAAVKSRMPAPYDELVGVGQAWAYADLGRVPEATAALASAVSVVETFKFEAFRPTISLIEGMIAEASGDLDTAIEHFREAADRAVQVEPAYRVRLSRALRLAGKDDEAMAVLDEALKVEPMHPEFQLELALLSHGRGDLEQAQKHLAVALAVWSEADPEFPPAKKARQLAAQFPTP